MKKIKYFLEFIIIGTLFLIFKILGLKLSSYFSGKLGLFFGPFFRSKELIRNNISRALPNLKIEEKNKIIQKMWNNYGRILGEFIFMKDFRNSPLNNNVKIEGIEILEEIKKNKESVIFVSGHFNNFELMAMEIEKAGVNVAAIYRPLNNIFINKIMENIRIKYICKNQVTKGIKSIKKLLQMFKGGYSIALMIDQRVSEGPKVEFFGKSAYTTTIPAQFVKKFKCRVVPIYIERLNNEVSFKMKIYDPIKFDPDDTIEKMTYHLNSWLEKVILKNPDQWIWTHNRWK